MKNNYFFKRTLSAVVMLMASSLMWAADFVVDGISYDFNEDGESVEVAQKDYWDNPSSGDIVIPSSVAYKGKTYSVTSIGGYAFYYCDSLTSIVIPNSVTSIGYSAFYGCSSLTSIVIPNSVTSIEHSAFYECSSLTSIIVADGNSVYDSREGCNAIIETASNTLIVGCQNTVIPNSVTNIGRRAFTNCSSLTSVVIPNSVTSIGEYAFYGCSSLTSIEIPNSVTSIGDYAFYSCSSLASVEISNSVTSIGDEAFSGCASLTSIIVAGDNPVYDSREGCNAIIETASNALIAGCQNTVIPNSVTSIRRNAFYGCSSLASVEIPNSVTSIEGWAFFSCPSLTSVEIPNSVTSIGSGAFGACSSLTSLIVADDNPVYDSREGCNAIIETASNTLIAGCQNTVISNSVTSIGNEAFIFCSFLTSVEIPNSVTSIGEYAFGECSSLASIEIPNSVTSIGFGAFNSCSSLTSVICYAEDVPELGWAVFFYVPQREATLYVPASALEAYKAADQWKEFGTILPIDEDATGIASTTAEQETDATYYTLDGVSVKNPTKKGIYIKNGKKVYMQ